MTEELSPQQRTLYEALADKDPKLASWYLGSITALGQEGNPERFVHAAHSLREIIEKIPNYIEVPLKAHHESLGVKVRELQDYCKPRLDKSKRNNGGKWEGEIDNPLRQVLKKQLKFSTWFEEHNPRRKEETKNVLRKLDSSPYNFPESLEEENISIWHKIREFFINVCHHNIEANQKDFAKWVNAFESFLLDRLCPRTFEDFDAIDKIIAEGEKNG